MQPGVLSGVIDEPPDNRQLSKLLLLSVMMITQVPCLIEKHMKMRILAFIDIFRFDFILHINRCVNEQTQRYT